MSTEKPTQTEHEYMTVEECQAVCRYKGPEAIRRAVYRGELPATRIAPTRLLIKATDFWTWFHRKRVKPKQKSDIDLFEPGELKRPEPI